MSIFDEDECGNIGEEVLGIPAFEILSILRSPNNMKPQLQNLYYCVRFFFHWSNKFLYEGQDVNMKVIQKIQDLRFCHFRFLT